MCEQPKLFYRESRVRGMRTSVRNTMTLKWNHTDVFILQLTYPIYQTATNGTNVSALFQPLKDNYGP